MYPLHFRKTYFPGRLHGDPKVEFDHHLLASRLCPMPPPIGHEPTVFRSCLIPGQPYARLTPFGADPPESNIAQAQKQPLATAAGLWRLAEETLAQLLTLHQGGLAHGDAELHNCIVCPAPLEPLLIDFEAAVRREAVEASAWKLRCDQDLAPLLREAIYLQCALGRQPSALGELSWEHLPRLFERPDRLPPRHRHPGPRLIARPAQPAEVVRSDAGNMPIPPATRQPSVTITVRADSALGSPNCRSPRAFSIRMRTEPTRGTNHERKHSTTSGDHGSDQLQVHAARPSTTRRPPPRRCSAPTSSAWPP